MIKKFNEYNQTFVDISPLESGKLGVVDSFSQMEYDYIKGFFNNYYVKLSSSGVIIIYYPELKVKYDVSYNVLNLDKIIFIICKSVDEWYYVISSDIKDLNFNRLYKCDQWEGLIDCLILLKEEYKLI